VTVITSRDCNHITWFCRNSASVSLLATLSHRTWVANDSFIISTLSKVIEILRLHFLKIFLQTIIFLSYSSFVREIDIQQWSKIKRFFHHLNSFKSDRNSQIALFENFSTNENFSFLLIFCTRNRHSTVIKDYIKRDDVIWRELDCLALIEIESKLHFLKFVVQTKKFLSDSFCVRENDTQRWSKII
jgi:hypothetical protein